MRAGRIAQSNSSRPGVSTEQVFTVKRQDLDWFEEG
jgi:hypothetical protein